MKRSPPSQQQRPRKAVSPCRCRDLAGTLKALHNDLELLLLRPPPSPACVHHLKPLDLGAAPISVHRDRFLIPKPLRKAAAAGGVRSSSKKRASSNTGLMNLVASSAELQAKLQAISR